MSLFSDSDTIFYNFEESNKLNSIFFRQHNFHRKNLSFSKESCKTSHTHNQYIYILTTILKNSFLSHNKCDEIIVIDWSIYPMTSHNTLINFALSNPDTSCCFQHMPTRGAFHHYEMANEDSRDNEYNENCLNSCIIMKRALVFLIFVMGPSL